MHAPVLVTPPADTPVSLDEAKAHLRVDHTDEDGLITSLIEAATGHLDGWTGILGRCLMDQQWRQDFDAFENFRLPLWPVTDIVSIKVRDTSGQISTIAEENYALKADALGAYVRFVDGYSYPSDLYQSAAISVTFKAGYADAASIPDALKAAILLLVGHWYKNREAVSDDGPVELPMAVNALIVPYRRVGI